MTGPQELVQLKVVIALLISPINFSEYRKEWEHNWRNVLTLQFLNSFPYLLFTDGCALCIIAHLSINLSPLIFA